MAQMLHDEWNQEDPQKETVTEECVFLADEDGAALRTRVQTKLFEWYSNRLIQQ
jgi:hypothetical protein